MNFDIGTAAQYTTTGTLSLPVFEDSSYGNKTSFGYPSPSSSIIISVISLSLLILINTLFLEYLLAFPIKFLNP